MLERVRSSFNGFDPRDVRVRNVVLFLGFLTVMIFCGGTALVINQLLQQNKNIPAAVPTPTPDLAAIIFSQQQAEVLPTATFPVPTIAPIATPKVVLEGVTASNKSPGEACIYSGAWINQAATPIPDGGFSEFLGYLCANGYWDLGIGDWVNAKGDWGEDGKLERAYIKFNRDGAIIDRKFFDLQGNKILGPID